jgi:hypothetical protein
LVPEDQAFRSGQLLIERGEVGDHRFGTEGRINSGSPGFTQTPGQVAVADDIADRSGQELGISHRNEDAGLAIFDDFRRSWCGGRDDGNAKLHRFEQQVGKSFVGAGKDDKIGGGHQPGHIVAMAKESELVVEMILVRCLFKPLSQGTVARDERTKVGLDVLKQVECLEQIVDSLLLG